jgi:uncharacterized membrane protein YfcA
MSSKNSRTDIAAWVAIIIGLVLGFLLKRVRFGFIFGLALGFVAVYMLFRKRK